jgi:hypothetical protein
MAKRAAAKGGVVISQEIFNLVKNNNSIKGPEVVTALREKYPKVDFNSASCQVAFANARKKLGLTRTVVKRPVGAAKPGRRPIGSKVAAVAPTSSETVNISLLQAAKALLVHCNGDANVAAQALKQVAALQMG